MDERPHAWFKPNRWDWGAFILWNLTQIIAGMILGFLILRGYLH
jgi:hypothetical protein